VRWQATLDHLIAHFAKRPVTRLDPEVVDILRLSTYQLLHLTRVPASAVVDDGVDLVKRAGKRSAAGFVNAILRNVSRSRRALPLPARPEDGTDHSVALDYLSITLSHPRWLAERWLNRVGFERAEAWMTFNNQPASLTVRANRLRTSRDDLLQRFAQNEVEAHAARYAPDALVIDSGNLRDEFGRGEFVMQDEASQLVALLAGQAPGPLVLDTCASPGGKATAIAETLGVGERLIACDIRERRMALLQRTVAATGWTNIRLVQADGTAPLPFGRSFSTVIVDAPCSGLGTLRRDPDIKWRRDPSTLPAFASSQRIMLDHAADVVAEGGRLVYATCSSEPDENEEVVAAFLAAHPEFTPLRADAAHPEVAADLVDERGHLRTEPDRHGLELFFGAVFERQRQL
jgi:16S rRNA (cytosine967-C5)-methyltransferase